MFTGEGEGHGGVMEGVGVGGQGAREGPRRDGKDENTAQGSKSRT